MRICALLLCSASVVVAQPRITAVVSAADFSGGIAYGGLGTVFGSGLADASYSATLPLPKKLGVTELFACVEGIRNIGSVTDAGCEALELLYAGPNQVNFRVFDSLPQKPGFAGTLYIVARVAGVTSEKPASAPGSQLSNLLLPYPRIFLMGKDRYTDSRFITPTTWQTTRGAVTDQQGQVLTSDNPARVGRYYTIWLTGLGQFSNGKPKTPVAMTYGDVPVFGYKGSTWFAAELAYVGPSPEFPGLYQINFQLSSVVAEGKGNGYGTPFPCGDYQWEISLDISQGSAAPTYANRIQIPVSVKSGDVSCAR